MEIIYRPYDKKRDRKAAQRIWQEVGWFPAEADKKLQAVMDGEIADGNALVAEINGAAEALVMSAPGDIRYLDETLPFSGVTGVTCSRVARKRGLARRLSARLVAEAAESGAAATGLGMFEQGFYNHLGFGTGAYDQWVSFDPAELKIDIEPRIPQRLTKHDWFPMLAGRLARKRQHGNVNLFGEGLMRGHFSWSKEAFGLGYWDESGRLTHHFWCMPKGENGPYRIPWFAYQTGEQFLELMALLKSIGDQVHCVQMTEPQGMQLQDLVRQPFRWGHLTKKGEYETFTHSQAWWQMRILDLEACVAAVRLAGKPVAFNLQLSDPIESFLSDEQTWRGLSGQYVLRLGQESTAAMGSDADLPTMTATVNAFSRLWLGVRPPSGLAITDDISAPPTLLDDLDRLLRLPRPSFDWEF